MIYVSSPYTSADAATVEYRVTAVEMFTGELLRRGVTAFSPIAHSHRIAKSANPPLPTAWEWWRKHDQEYILSSGALVVLMLPGWQESKGVADEIELAQRSQLPVLYFQVGGNLDLLAEELKAAGNPLIAGIAVLRRLKFLNYHSLKTRS